MKIITWFKSLLSKNFSPVTGVEESHARVRSREFPQEGDLVANITHLETKVTNVAGSYNPRRVSEAHKRKQSTRLEDHRYRGTSPAIPTINNQATADTVALFPNLHSSTSHVSPSCHQPSESVSSSSHSSYTCNSSSSSSSSSSFD